MKDLPEHIVELLIAYHHQELTPDDSSELSQWLSENNSSQKAANEYIRLLEHLNAFDVYQKVDAQNSWKEVAQKTSQKPGWHNPRLITPQRILRIASSIAAILVMAFLAYKGTQYFDQEKQMAEAHLMPGSSRAELVLGGGEVIELEPERQEHIQEEGTIIENESGTLEYTELKEVTAKPAINKLRVPRGGEYKLKLSDGTKVWLNSESELSFPVAFVNNERAVKLRGEAYFEVTANKTKPFVVDVDGQEIVVLGTHFNVSAYADDNEVVTTLVEGKVSVTTMDSAHMQEILLPNEQLVYYHDTHKLIKQNIDTHEYTAWKDGLFIFRQKPLKHIMKVLGRWYDVEVCFAEEELSEFIFAGDLSKSNSLHDFISVMEMEMSVKVKLDDKKIYISKVNEK